MHLIENANQWWKLWSVRVFALITALPAIWVAIPDDVKAQIPPSAVAAIVSALGVLGAIVRVIQQEKLLPPPLTEADAQADLAGTPRPDNPSK